MRFLPDTNTCINFLRQRNSRIIQRWQQEKPHDIVLCSVVVYELRYGAERSSDSTREHAKLDSFVQPYLSVFDDTCARHCAGLRRSLERTGTIIGPHDLQIASIALSHNLTLVTHNTKEFSRLSNLTLEDWEL
jgi:tRNA(fMet)-specific endonuclease VapC